MKKNVASAASPTSPSSSRAQHATARNRFTNRGVRYDASFANHFIMNNRAAALATLGEDNKPHVSVVYCLAGDDLSIYFSTSTRGKKYANLLIEPNISMVFQNEKMLQTIQLDGTAEIVDRIDQAQQLLHDLMKLRYDNPNWPQPSLHVLQPGSQNQVVVIKVTPTEMTFANFKTSRTGQYKARFNKII